jgi:Protein of unknown function (DUF3667)
MLPTASYPLSHARLPLACPIMSGSDDRGPHEPSRCLNCEAQLSGPSFAACGQRAVRANPTVGEPVGDVWRELSGYDGRIAHTFRSLLLHPGRLTCAFLDGRRAQYISPVCLYLTARSRNGSLGWKGNKH